MEDSRVYLLGQEGHLLPIDEVGIGVLAIFERIVQEEEILHYHRYKGLVSEDREIQQRKGKDGLLGGKVGAKKGDRERSEETDNASDRNEVN